MLQALVNQLHLIPILHTADILKLKAVIAGKSPDSSSQERAAALATVLHRILDSHLEEFDQTSRGEVRLQVLKKAVEQNNFNLHAGHIFSACSGLTRRGREFNSELGRQLADWLNRQRQHPALPETAPVTGQQLQELLASGETRANNIASSVLSFSFPGAMPGRSALLLIQLLLLPIIQPLYSIMPAVLLPPPSLPDKMAVVIPQQVTAVRTNQLPTGLKNKEVNRDRLEAVLRGKNSLLAEEPFLGIILETAREFDLNPLLLLAIAGQEQAFVPKDSEHAQRIVNNPYNVFHSWQEYNTDIRDSTRIAARTVVNASAGRPRHVDPFFWLNRRYAEDPNWWKGVKSIYSDLEKQVTEKPPSPPE
ncbi:MAG TPA: hypothetical protein VHS59_00445 [Bacillota bacterium]|nr:hypothetical protein [Bacillota bacterium]